jgi:hypothetical protein
MNDLNFYQLGLSRTVCGLCGKNSPLCESHILPAFAYRSLKNSSATGHIRFSDNPNLRVQDGIKEPLLCKTCDNVLVGSLEKEFSEKLFEPWFSDPKIRRYEKYLLRFAVSVSWRVLKFCYGKNPNTTYSTEQLKLVQEAEKRWRMYLLNQCPHPAEFEQHFFIYGNLLSANEQNLPKNINRFARNSIMFDLVGSNSSLYTFAKFGQFFIFGHIQPSNYIWRGTKLHVNSGEFPVEKIVLPKQIWSLFVEKANLQAKASSEISDVQFSKIDNAILLNIDRAAYSGSFEAALMDAELFGKDAITRKKH